MQNDLVVIVPYDPNWPVLFEQEKTRILADIGQHVQCIEHMGSTAVPGLAAKPVIDILIGVRSLADAPRFIPPLTARGYEYISRYETEMPFRRYLNRKVNGVHTHHLHMVEVETQFFREQLAFRDYLRTHPETCTAYAVLKLNLSERYRTDRAGYTDAKAAFIHSVLQKCEALKGD